MMNRTWKSVFSVVLAIALLLPMVPAARAAEKITFSSNVEDNTVYYRSANTFHDAYAGEITVTVKVTDAEGGEQVTWRLEPKTGPLSFVSPQGVNGVATGAIDEDGTARVTLKASAQPAASVETVSLYAEVGDSDVNRQSSFTRIWVKQDKVDTSTVSFSSSELSVQVGKTVKVKLSTPRFPSGNGTPEVTYSSNKTSVATVAADGTVTGVAPGRAEISATVDGEPLDEAKKVVISVLSPSAAPTGNATLGAKFSMNDISVELRDLFRDSFGEAPEFVRFTSLDTNNGTLRTKSGTAVDRDNPYNFSSLGEMYLDPTSEGDFKCTAIVSDSINGSSAQSITATITITVSAPTATVLIPIDGSTNYSFLRASADPSGKTGARLIKDAIGTFGSLIFGDVSSESSNVGALYTATPVSNDNRVSRGTVVAANALDDLYFTPSRAGTYTVPFTAYSGANGSGTIVCRGNLILPVDGASLDLTVNLDSLDPYTFSETLSGSTTSLYLTLLNAINGSIGSGAWGGIRFDGAASASSSSVGTLHETSAHPSAISADNYIAKGNISKLYYEPKRSGTYEITYGVYSDADSAKAIVTGKLTINTSTIPAGAADITYTTLVKDSVTLQESDFIDFFQKENGNKYQLSYVVFDEYDGNGSFYHRADSFLPYNTANFYTSTYTGSVPTNARYLERLSFTAPASAGYTAVLFTCYGGTTADSTDRKTTGKLCIFYTADDVPAVSYNVLNAASVSFKEDGFVTAYNAAMKTSISKPVFTIQLLNTPGKGTLYYYYGNSNSRRTLTSNNITGYTFSINDKSGVSVDTLSYEPGRNASGTDEISYMAMSASGTILYVGTIQFKLSSDLTLNVTNDGSNFQLSDFYNSSDNDPVLYVTFPQPAAGKVYVDAGGRYIAVSSSTKLYTISAVDGQYPLTSAFYAPRANETGTVSLKCVVHRRSGVTNNNTITMNVLTKVSSGTFGDVSGVFDWAANSIDFASKMGLVNGTQLNPPLFSPGNTMRRSDFVLMLYRLAGSPAVSGSASYTDVTPDKYYYDSAVWASRNNIMRNVTVNNLYNPEGALTRQDFAQILFNYTAAIGESTANNGSLSSYLDASSVSAGTREGVTWAVANGYITSAVVGRLYIEPTRSATRAEISTLLHRYLTY